MLNELGYFKHPTPPGGTTAPYRGLSFLVLFTHLIMFIVEYRTPYTDAPRTQSFQTRDDAERMAAFYRSCGTRASVRNA